MIEHNGTWSGSVTMGLPVLVVVAIALTLSIIFFRKLGQRNSDIIPEMTALSVIVFVCLIALVTISGFAFYPFKGDYHRYQPISGKIQTIDDRFMVASQYMVYTFDTGLTVRCDDSRCVTTKPGDTVRLLCTKEHQYGSPLEIDGWGCRWGQ